MKRILNFALFLLVAFALAACGNTTDSQQITSEPTQSVVDSFVASAPISAPVAAVPDNTIAAESEYYFRDGVLVSEDVKIVITDWRVIPVGEAGNEYGEAPAIAFWYDITNLSGSEGISPMMGWMAMFTAVQDNDPNMVNDLDAAMHPDSALVDNQMAEIKEGGTLQGAMAYVLTDETTPVILKATKGLLGEDLGEQTFEIV